MSQQIVSQSTSADGQWQTTRYDDGTTVTGPAPGSATATAQTNQQTLLARAQQALTANATFLAVASPTTAQVATQVKALTRQVNALIKLAVTQDFTDISNT